MAVKIDSFGGRTAETEDIAAPRGDGAGRRAQVPTFKVVWTADSAWLGKLIPFVGPQLLLGRDIAEHGVAIADRGMSRLHLRAQWDARLAGVRVHDAESRNGTFVNGARVESALLCHGDVVRIGDTLLSYSEEPGFSQLTERAQTLARSPLTVLLQGETGTGKEHMAQLIHQASERPGPLVAVNCAALPRELVAAELFGHTESAFSGARGARKGLVLSAARGTLFLDEIGDCPHEAQVALLRVLQEKTVRPLGSDREQLVDVRVIAASHRDLARAVADGSFRADLLARLTEATIALPPLRERKHELLELAQAFARDEGATLTFATDAAEALLAWSYPYNLRELQSLVRAFLVLRPRGSLLDLDFLRESYPQLAQAVLTRAGTLTVAVSERPEPGEAPTVDRKRLRALLEAEGGNVSRVAKLLGKPRVQVYRWMEALGLSAEQFRSR